MFSCTSRKNHTDPVMVLCTSYNISLQIARFSKPYTIREEFIPPTVREGLHTLLHKLPEQIKSVPFSDNSVQRRVDEMAKTC